MGFRHSVRANDEEEKTMGTTTFEVYERLGILSESANAWTKELRLINWNGRGLCYDLRAWAPGDRRFGIGITLSLSEIRQLQDILMEIDLPSLEDDEAQDYEGEEGFESKYSSLDYV